MQKALILLVAASQSKSISYIWAARVIGVREVASSNLAVPTIHINHLRLPTLAAVFALRQIESFYG